MPTSTIVSAVTPRNCVSAKSDKRRREGEDEGVQGDDQRSCARYDAPAERDGERRADACRRRYAERERVGERIAEDRLHAGAGKPQHGADQAGDRAIGSRRSNTMTFNLAIGRGGVEERR